MTPFDRKYISSQFWNAIHRKSGTEYQTFFEAIMEKAYPGFQRIRPYGNEGDKGNDGYRPAEGIYYQVYAPLDARDKEQDAAEKFKIDFAKLKLGWDKIAAIRELHFVYNDKGSGLTVKIEAARAELAAANPTIAFRIFTPKHVEELLLSLSSDQVSALGFDVDSRNALQNARDQLAKLDKELDKENGAFVLNVLEAINDIVTNQNDEHLLLEFELLEARALQKVERVPEARARFESIRKRYPKDASPLLYLAEICLNTEDFDGNAQLLAEAEQIAPAETLVWLQRVLRDLRLEVQVDPATIDETKFPTEPRERSNFYRLYAHALSNAGDQVRADAFAERALRLNFDKFSNHDTKISFLEQSVWKEENVTERRAAADVALDQIRRAELAVGDSGGLSPRSRSLLNFRKMRMYMAKEDYAAIETMSKETIELLLQCYFDQLIEKIMVTTMRTVDLPPVDLARLQEYLRHAEKPVSDTLAKTLLAQLAHKGNPLAEARSFFRTVKKENLVEFIDALARNDQNHVLAFIGDDLEFAVDIALGIKEPAELRSKIVDSLPDDGSVDKDKLYVILHRDAGDLNKAFEIVQRLDLRSLSHIECVQLLPIAEQKKAWDIVAIILEKQMETERDSRAMLGAKLKLFTANVNLERLPEVIRVGKDILANPDEMQLLDSPDKESLVAHTGLALLRRRDVGVKEFIRAHESLLTSFEGKVGAQAEVYLKSGDADAALRSIVEGVKLLGHPSPEKYGMLFLIFSEIGNMMPTLTRDSVDEVVPESFVKLAGQERWFFVGSGEPLDASKVGETDPNYAAFIDKKVGDDVSFKSAYRAAAPEYRIETILPVERYILWQSSHHVQRLSAEHRWDAIELIEVPITDDGIDPKFLIAKLEDVANKRGPFFELYCEQDAPFAFLAVNEGGVAEAIGRISDEQRGFIKATSGSPHEFEQQKSVARRLLAGDPFYLDGTAAVVLSDTGLLARIAEFVPGLNVPQSVVTLLLNLRDKFEYVPGRAGRMGYVKGQIQFSEMNRELSDAVYGNFSKSIDALETKPERIAVISAASKSEGFMEQRIPASLADAIILAQRDSVPVLTEDFLYLKAHEIETKKAAPEYCSTIALMRTLYEEGRVRFEDYLDHFSHLAGYRVRFLALTTDDLEKAVFGDQVITVVRPELLRKFKFGLTLSEEYGVQPGAAFQVVGSFLFRVLRDDWLSPEDATKIFAELLSTFPTNENRKSFGRMLLAATVKALSADRRGIIIAMRVKDKVDAIVRFWEFYGTEPLIMTAWT